MRQTIDWKPIEESRYWDALGALPPAAHRGFGFLLGEAQDHNSLGVDVFRAFAQNGRGDCFEAEQFLTIRQFNSLQSEEQPK